MPIALREARIALHEEILSEAPNSISLSEVIPRLKKRLGPSSELSEAKWIEISTSAAADLEQLGILEARENKLSLLWRAPNVWLEKSLVGDRADRLEGPFALGKALWSPKRGRSGGDTYSAMRDLRPNDLVLHLIDNAQICGVSRVSSYASTDFRGIKNTEWSGVECYVAYLESYRACDPPFHRKDFLGNGQIQSELAQIRGGHKNLFYDRHFHLMQGFYLTKVPAELLDLLNHTYSQINGHPLPHLDSQHTDQKDRSALADPETTYSEAPTSVPHIPDQEPGPKFALRDDGIVDFDISQPEDKNQNDTARLQSLHGVILDAAQDLLREFSRGTNQHVELAVLTRQYFDQINREIENIDFARLYGIGLRLQIALEAANRQIDDRLLPDLEDPTYEALESLARLHGVYIQASFVGQQLLAAAERYEFKPGEIPKLKDALADVESALASRPDLVDPGVTSFLKKIVRDIGQGKHPERIATYSIASFSNLLIVFTEVAATTWLASALGPNAVGGLGGFAGASMFFLSRRRGKEALRFAKRIADDLEEPADKKLRLLIKAISDKYVRFVLDNEKALRRIATFSSRLQFLDTHIDWLNRNSNQSDFS